MSVCVPRHIVCQTYIPDFVAGATLCTLQVFSERKSRLEAGGTLFRSVEVGTPTNNISISCEWQTALGEQTSIPDDVTQVEVVITDGTTIETYNTPQSYTDPNWVVSAIPDLRNQINTTNPSSLIRMPEFDTDERFVEPVDIVDTVDADHLAEFTAPNLSGGNGAPDVAGLVGLRTGPSFSLVLIDSSEINNDDGTFDNIDTPIYWGQVDGSPVTLDWLPFTPTGDCLDPSDPNNVIISGSGSPGLPYECGILYRPVFNQDILNREDEEESIISFSAAATDPNDDTITYSATNLPQGISIDVNTGLISGTLPLLGSPIVNLYDVTITADDGRGGVANDTFIWTVVIVSESITSFNHSNLVAAWTMDNISGATLVDESVNGYDSTITGAIPVSGLLNQALDFNSTSTYLTHTLPAFGINDFAISLWYNPDDLTIYPHLLTDATDQLNFLFKILRSGAGTPVPYFYGTGAAGPMFHSTEVPLNSWTHLVLMRNGTDIYISVNSALELVGTGFTDNLTGTTFYTGIGYPGEYSNGQQDQMRIFDRALTQDEIDILYNGGVGA